MTWDEISSNFFYDYEHSVTGTLNGPADIIDIKDQMNIAGLYGSNTIAFIPPAGANIGIGIDALTFWDATLGVELFSVWENW
jgi:hypothetical protein